VLPAFAADGDITDTKTGTVYQASSYNSNTQAYNTLVNSLIGGTTNQFAYSFGGQQFGFDSYSTAVTTLLATPGETVAQAKTAAAKTVPPIVTTTIATVSAVNPTIAVGGTTGFTFANSDGTAATPTGVVYSVTSANASTAFFNGGVFTATAAGTYTVQATIGTTNLTTTVTVAGIASAVKLSTSPSTISANNTTKQTVTVNIVDANNNVVTNFNGTVTLNSTANGAFTVLSNVTGTAAGVNYVLPVTNGTATFQIQAGATANVTDTITPSLVVSTNAQPIATNVTYSTLAVTSTAPSATALTVSSSPSKLGVNVQQQATITVKGVDANSATVTSATNYVTLTLSGPASFSSSSSVQTQTVQLASGVNTSAIIYSTIGGSGNIVVTANATGLTSGSVTIPTVLNTAVSGITATSSAGTTTAQTADALFPANNAFTLYTVQLVDTNGNPITTGSDIINLSDNTGTVGGVLKYYAVSSTGQPTGNALSSLSGLTLSNGSTKFIVMNTTAGNSAATITVTDSTQNYTATGSYSFVTGTPSNVTAVQSSAGSVKQGQSVTFQAQLVDASGNKLKQSGQSVTFGFATANAGVTFPNNGTTYVAQTDINGLASVTATVSNTATSTFQVSATFGSQTAVNEGSYSIVIAGNYISQLKWATSNTAASALTSWATTSFAANANVFTAGTSTAVDLVPENAVSALPTTFSDTFKLTVSDKKVLVISPSSNSWSTVTNNSDGSAYVKYTASGASAGFALPVVTATAAGTATITIQDTSNPDAPTLTQTVTVNAGAVSAPQFWYNGSQISSTNPLNVVANTPVQIQVVTVDAGGSNAVPVTGLSPYGVQLADSNSGTFSLTSSGAQIYDVVVPVGQSSYNVYYKNATTQTITSGFTGNNSNSAPQTSPASIASGTGGVTAGSAYNVTLTLLDSASHTDSAVNGTYTVTISNLTAAAHTDGTTTYGYFNGSAILAASQAFNVTFTNGVATVPLILLKATSTPPSFAVSGAPLTGVSAAVTATAAAATTINPVDSTCSSATTSGAIVVTYTNSLYTDSSGTAVANNADIKAKYTSTLTGVTISSAIYNAAAKTVTFTLSGGATSGNTVVLPATTLYDLYGNAAPTRTFTWTTQWTQS